MAFSVADYQDLLRLLREHPEWRAELRQQILDEEFQRLPEYVRQNSVDIRELREAVAQNSADIRELKEVVAQNSADIRELREAVAQNSADIRELKEVVAQNSAAIRELKEVVAQNSADIRELKEVVAQNSVQIRSLTDAVDRVTARMDRSQIRLDYSLGMTLEMRYRTHPHGYFNKLVRRGRTIVPDDLALFAAADEAETITEAQAEAVRALDIIVEGVQGRGDARQNVLLAVEISVVIDSRDVDRAADRATTLRDVGYPNTKPVVVGAVISPEVAAYAERRGVTVQIDNEPRLAS